MKIAITGGIGSGKSTVSAIIARLGYPVFSCDEIYGELLNQRGFAGKISALCGVELNPDGSLNRAEVSARVFKDKALLAELNRATHPAIMEEALKKCAGLKLAFVEVPLLFENGFEKLFDGAIVVLRDKSARVRSLSERSRMSVSEAEMRINSQFDYENHDFAEYYVIHNNGDFDHLRANTEEILNLILKQIN